MNGKKVLFWIFTIALGFVNPLISFALVFLYYLPQITESQDDKSKDDKTFEVKVAEIEKNASKLEMNHYSTESLEEMK